MVSPIPVEGAVSGGPVGNRRPPVFHSPQTLVVLDPRVILVLVSHREIGGDH